MRTTQVQQTLNDFRTVTRSFGFLSQANALDLANMTETEIAIRDEHIQDLQNDVERQMKAKWDAQDEAMLLEEDKEELNDTILGLEGEVSLLNDLVDEKRATINDLTSKIHRVSAFAELEPDPESGFSEELSQDLRNTILRIVED